MGAPIRSTPNMLKLPYASRISLGMSIWTQKTKPQVGRHSTLLEGKCKELNKKAQGPSSLSLCNWEGSINRTNNEEPADRYALMQPKIQGFSCKSDHLCCFFFRALKQKHLQGGCPFYSNKIVKKSRCLHMLHMFSYKTIAYRNCFNIVQCHIQRTIFVIQGQRKTLCQAGM